MSKFDITTVEPAALLKLVQKAGGQRAFARKHGLPRTTIQDRLHKLKRGAHRPAPVAKRIGEKRGIRRFILTSAQDGTQVNEPFLHNLEAYRDWLRQSGDCELMVAGYTYNKSLFEDHATEAAIWPARIAPYIVTDRIRIADKVDFCAEMNTLPTATTPLSGLNSYSQDRWGIFPHAKVQLVSVSRLSHLPPKQNMTTGTITKPNYVMKKAGIKASFHHIYAAVLVEVDHDGDFFCRHLMADDHGDFYDLDRLIENGNVTEGHRLAALAPGDIHVAGIDPTVAKAVFGFWPTDQKGAHVEEPRIWKHDVVEPCMMDVLQPEHLFVHDVLDFRARNHHSIRNARIRHQLHVSGFESVAGEVSEVAMFLSTLATRYLNSTVYVVDSNHDQALERWLNEADFKTDPINAIFYLRNTLSLWEADKRQDKNYFVFRVAANSFPEWDCSRVRFLKEDRKEDAINIHGVEYAAHGHRGPNGSRGGVAALSQLSSKMSIGHVHSPAILNGLFASGMSCLMDQQYNKGPTGWSATLTGQYQNGKRTLITLQGPKWRVE